MRLDIGEVDVHRAVVLTGDGERKLRPLELKLLQYLADRVGQVVSIDALLQAVWGYAAGVESRTVYATVNRLRLAIERDPQRPTHLHTVPGVGYRFELAVAPVSGRPRAADEIVGRDVERVTLHRMLAAGGTVRVTGPVGVGKSRLAAQVAGDLERDGRVVRWVRLTDAVGVQELDRRVAVALGLPAAAGPGRIDAALDVRELVLVLDDADGVEPRQWGCTVLVTSRAPGPADRVLLVNPMDEEASTELLRRRLAERSPAPVDPIQLAAAVRVAGGLPLALELVAPWLALGEAPAVERLLHGGGGTLAAALARTWTLLGEPARDVLTGLSTFEAAFSLDDARGLVGDQDDVVLDLVQRAWLRVEQQDARRVFLLLPTHRAFVRERSDPRRLGEARRRHASWCAHDPEELERLYFVGGDAWRRVVARAPDLRLAARYAEKDETRVALAVPLARILLAEGPLETCLEVVDGVLPLGLQRPTLLRYRAVACRNLGRHAEARATLLEVIADPTSPRAEVGRALRALGVVETYLGLPEASGRLREALAVLIATEARLDAAITRAELGTYHYLRGEFAEAVALLEAALGPMREAGASVPYGVYLTNLGVIEFVAGWNVSAREHLTRALEVNQRLGATRFQALALGNLALIADRAGDPDEARTRLEAAFVLARAAGDRLEEATLWSNQGWLAARAGRSGEAREALDQAIALASAVEDARTVAEALTRRAVVELEAGEPARARFTLDQALEQGRAFVIEHANARAVLARLSHEAGDLEGARAALDGVVATWDVQRAREGLR